MESYRSGHNGAVLKTVRRQRHRGSNPLLSATSEQTSYRLLRLFSKVRAHSFCCSSFSRRTRCAGLRRERRERGIQKNRQKHIGASFVSLAPTFFKTWLAVFFAAPAGAYSSAHSRAHFTALCQPSMSFTRLDSSMAEVNTRSTAQLFFTSSRLDQ